MAKNARIKRGLRKALKAARGRDKAALRRGDTPADSRRAILKGRGWIYS